MKAVKIALLSSVILACHPAYSANNVSETSVGRISEVSCTEVARDTSMIGGLAGGALGGAGGTVVGSMLGGRSGGFIGGMLGGAAGASVGGSGNPTYFCKMTIDTSFGEVYTEDYVKPYPIRKGKVVKVVKFSDGSYKVI